MKTLKNILSVSILPLLMLSLQQCHEEPLSELEKLPPATQSGKRTFGCLVDGKAQYIKGITNVSSFYQTGTFAIHAGLGGSLIQIHLDTVNLKEKTYQLQARLNGPGSRDARYYDGTCDFTTTNENIGTITITHLDKVNFIVSGTFYFDAYSQDCSKLVKVTDGRFDIHYAA